VFGNSFATIDTPFGGAHSENGYTADGEHFAKGRNFSEAGVEFTRGGSPHGPKPGKGGNDWRGMGGKRWGGMAWRGKPGGGGHHGGGHHGGGTSRVTSVRVFAGGFSSASAW
jgi:hypothetical protein